MHISNLTVAGQYSLQLYLENTFIGRANLSPVSVVVTPNVISMRSLISDVLHLLPVAITTPFEISARDRYDNNITVGGWSRLGPRLHQHTRWPSHARETLTAHKCTPVVVCAVRLLPSPPAFASTSTPSGLHMTPLCLRAAAAGGEADFFNVKIYNPSDPNDLILAVNNDYGDGSYSITFTPAVSGGYTIFVNFTDGMHPKQQAFTSELLSATPDMYSVLGEGLTGGDFPSPHDDSDPRRPTHA